MRGNQLIVWQNNLCKFTIEHVDLAAKNNLDQTTQEQEIFHKVILPGQSCPGINLLIILQI